MKKFILAAATVLFANMSMDAQTVKVPAPSPTQSIKQDFALSSIEVSYSRPGVKGRSIFGDVVPFGKLWRTGANGCTKLTFGEDVKVGGVEVKAGTYSLFSVPNKDEWEIILNKNITIGGLDGYKTEDDVARFKVKTAMLGSLVETFSIQVANVTSSTADIQISWEKTSVNIPVVADIDTKISKSIETAMTVDNRPYFQAASYYLETGKDLGKALTWVDKAIEMNPKAFWMVHLKAKIQAQSGDKVGAIATAKKSIELAKEAKNNDYVALNEKLIASLK